MTSDPPATRMQRLGLSMDYEVFLVSRINEEWRRTGDAARAMREGHRGPLPRWLDRIRPTVPLERTEPVESPVAAIR